MPLELTDAPGIGPATARRLARLGIEHPADLLLHVPRTYIDREHITRAIDAREGLSASFWGQIRTVRTQKTRRPGLWLIRARLEDASGYVTLTWFVYRRGGPPPAPPVQQGDKGVATGRVTHGPEGAEISTPLWERSDRRPVHGLAPVPVYSVTEGISQNKINQFIDWALTHAQGGVALAETEPDIAGLPPWDDVFRALHRPRSSREAEAARRRLAFAELLSFAQTADRTPAVGSVPLSDPDVLSVEQFGRRLPFTLTSAQRRAMEDCDRLFQQTTPRGILLQGDVGSGKTVVAAYAGAKAVLSGLQASLMVPTRLLAEQHADTLGALLAPWSVPIVLLTAATDADTKERVIQDVKAGKPLFVVGTHALSALNASWTRLALNIIDEQHRFGVAQRDALARSRAAHTITMSATPIPRSLAMILYLGHDIIRLDEKPPGRQPVDTRWIRPEDRAKAYAFFRREVARGQQGFVVFPRIHGEGKDSQGVVDAFDHLKRTHLRGLSVDMLHGEMSAETQEDVMARFIDGAIDVLVATTVIEVGIDVRRANVMIVEEAHRFGLAQLHQLRGRVGRGRIRGTTLLIADPDNDTALRRIDALRRYDDGFDLAEIDLKLRGPGELDGLVQSGFGRLRALDLVRDKDILAAVRRHVGNREQHAAPQG